MKKFKIGDTVTFTGLNPVIPGKICFVDQDDDHKDPIYHVRYGNIKMSYRESQLTLINSSDENVVKKPSLKLELGKTYRDYSGDLWTCVLIIKSVCGKPYILQHNSSRQFAQFTEDGRLWGPFRMDKDILEEAVEKTCGKS